MGTVSGLSLEVVSTSNMLFKLCPSVDPLSEQFPVVLALSSKVSAVNPIMTFEERTILKGCLSQSVLYVLNVTGYVRGPETFEKAWELLILEPKPSHTF